MIIARAAVKGEDEMLILGLSRENITRLTNGEPMRLRRESHGDGIPDGWEICIMFGETERDMAAQFEEHGLIGPETTIHRDPRL